MTAQSLRQLKASLRPHQRPLKWLHRPQPFHRPPPRRNRKALFDSIILGALGAILIGIAHSLDLAERFFEFSRAHESWQLDEIVFITAPILVVLFVIFTVRRWLDMRQLLDLAYTDKLTGLLNRHGVSEALGLELYRSGRYGRPLTLLLLDIDHFKQINDTYGHRAGDEVLKACAQLLQGSVRNVDFVARWGGEEFLIIAPETAPVAAWDMAERIREQMARHTFGIPATVTISIGLASFHKADTIEALVHRADIKLYAAKAAGRNRSTM